MGAALQAYNTAALVVHSKQAQVAENNPVLDAEDSMVVAEDTDAGTRPAEHRPVQPEVVELKAVAVVQQAAKAEVVLQV